MSETGAHADTIVLWDKIADSVLLSRALDDLEENVLVPEGKVRYQFSARGHEFAQVVLGQFLVHPEDCVSAYYRSRPLLLSLGLSADDALAAPMAKSGGFSDGRDIGVVCNMPNPGGPTVIPMAGDVGSQYTPAVGWAQSLKYNVLVRDRKECEGAISVVLGGDGSVATNGFWSAINIATTLELPILFFIEDNGFGISVPGEMQTPGGNIAENLASFGNLKVYDGDGTDPQSTPPLIAGAVNYVRSWAGPALIRLQVPRLCGHSGQDTQSYKSSTTLEKEREADPLPKLERHFSELNSPEEWDKHVATAAQQVQEALAIAEERDAPSASNITGNTFFEGEHALSGGTRRQDNGPSQPSTESKARLNMVAAIRATLDSELIADDRVLVFGEDVGEKGGVHAATLDLQRKHGPLRVFDTSLSEEGIIGRAVGMALAGLMPVAEIQFRKYADPAMEQLNNCGTIRWRTNNRFCAPIVARMPGGFAKVGDPWHSVSNETLFAHAVGWRVAVPSNAEDAVGLLRGAIRGNDPTIFFEHRALLDSPHARRPYPGDNYVLPFGVARVVQTGTDITVVSWGAMVHRCEIAASASKNSVEVIDLRTISPWDFDCVENSIAKTSRCIVVHEDTFTAGFGAEIVASITERLFDQLDAPVLRLAVPDVPIPHNVELMESVLPTQEKILDAITKTVSY